MENHRVMNREKKPRDKKPAIFSKVHKSKPLNKTAKSDKFAPSNRSERSERPDRSDRFDRSSRSERPVRSERFERSDRPVRSERFERSARPERSERSDRFDRSSRTERPERFERSERSDRTERKPFGAKKNTAFGKSDSKFKSKKKFGSFDKFDKSERLGRSDRTERTDRADRPRRSDRPERSGMSERSHRPRDEHKDIHQTREKIEKVVSTEKIGTTVFFNDFEIIDSLKTALSHKQFISPTPIQEKAIPVALSGRDILGSAQTGTGKTLAFGIPILHKLLSAQGHREAALMMAPTRELAAQISKAISELLPKNSFIKTALLIGGDPIGKQFRDLKNSPQIIIGTPGRINDHLDRKSLNLKHVKYLVLDEADRMMDMGFEPQINQIISLLPEDRQTFLFSATLSTHIVKLAQKYMEQPERISVGEQHQVVNIHQEAVFLKPSGKYSTLLAELDKRTGSIIIFVKTKRGADELASQLDEDDHGAEAIHGDLPQRKRERVIFQFRQQKHRILVATDVAARGLDIPHIEHVINYDLPQTPEDYMHRIGRTARAGKSGDALSFVTPGDQRRWKDIQRFMRMSQEKSKHSRK